MLLFLRACGGDAARASRVTTTLAAVTGILGLLTNQLGGKLSDAIGRKSVFLTGPIGNILMGLVVHCWPTALWSVSLCKVLKTTGTTLSGTVMSLASFMDINSPA